MTLSRLIELYEAEQKGKQIMQIEFNVYYPNKINIKPIKLSECELSYLITTSKYGPYYDFFIKDEEDENGNKM